MSLILRDFYWAPGFTFEKMQASALQACLILNKGDTIKAAEELGIGRATVYRLVNRYFSKQERSQIMKRRVKC